MGATKTQQPYQLYQRGNSTRWYVRFSIEGEGQSRNSLDTDDGLEAQRRAMEVWGEAKYR